MKEGTATLEDDVFVRADWLRTGANKVIAARFVRASLRGWMGSRDNAAECVDMVIKESLSLAAITRRG